MDTFLLNNISKTIIMIIDRLLYVTVVSNSHKWFLGYDATQEKKTLFFTKLNNFKIKFWIITKNYKDLWINIIKKCVKYKAIIRNRFWDTAIWICSDILFQHTEIEGVLYETADTPRQVEQTRWWLLLFLMCFYPLIPFIFYEYTKYFDINDIVFQSWQIRMKYSQRKSQMTITITQIIDQEEIVTVTL